MRKGVILSYNKKAGIGVIKDSNDQHILFNYAEMKGVLLRNRIVDFDIEFCNGSLAAVDLNFSETEDSSSGTTHAELI